MSKRFYYKWAPALLVLLGMQESVWAQFEEGKEQIKFATPLVGSAIVANATSTVTYDNQGELPNKKITNIITLKIDEQSTVFPLSGFTVTVPITVEVRATLGGSWQTLSNVPSLVVTYDPVTGVKYNARSYFKLAAAAEEVKITVGTVSKTVTSGTWDPLSLLKLENEMRILRYFELANTGSLLTPAFNTAINNTDALTVSWAWNTATNNNLSQLEWAWVENDLESLYFPGGVLDADFLFNNNSTRIDLDFGTNSFKIPLLYPNAGKLYYRVRAALRKNDGNVFAGPWSPVQNFAFTGHEINLNWQSSTSFAENGKYKTVIQYFDGSLRGRQTVTKYNERENVIVGETLYDLQGRPNVQILPTPVGRILPGSTIEQTIKFFSDFNRFTGQTSATQNPAELFDLAAPGAVCTGAPALMTTQGNGRYYSPNNDWLIGAFAENKSKYIPNAQGYVYTETRFMDDATERVRSQGGVGPDHRIGSGHETKYFYGKPNQQELDALFGTEVGDASHYSKNMVKDANGQMSVSYTDMHGRTVATALAGDAPNNVVPINSNVSDYPQAAGTLTNQLLTPTTNLVKGNSIESLSTILAPATTTYNFSYSLDPAIFSQQNCASPAQTICWDCKYDLEITIRPEDCSSVPIVRKYSNLQLVAPNLACGVSMGFIGEGITTPAKQISFAETLAAGAWVVRKTLTINENSFTERKALALQEFLCTTEAAIYLEVKNALTASSGCNVPDRDAAACAACNIALGANYQEYKTKYLTAIGNPIVYDESAIAAQYAADQRVCAAACKPGANFSSLQQLRDQMLADVTPFTGQYALDPATNTLGAEESKHNIFTSTPLVAGKPKPFFRNPKMETGAAASYPGSTGIDINTITPVEFGGVFVSPWASQLIYYHPEFSKLKFAENNLVSTYKWFDDVQLISEFALAQNGGYLNPITSDPYFVNNYVPQDKTDITRYIGSYIPVAGTTSENAINTPSIWQLANATVSCATVPDGIQKEQCILQRNKAGLDAQITTTADKDRVWQTFKGLYLSYRNEMVTAYIHSQPNVLTATEMASLQTDKKQLRFARAQEIANQNGTGSWWQAANNGNTTAVPGLVNTYLTNNSLNIDRCTAQKPFWKSRLLQCEQLIALINSDIPANIATANTVINAILDGMVLVCQNSKTITQPNGASTVDPAYTGTPRSFEEVINNVFAQYQIVTNAGNVNYFCNPFSIDAPKPFGKNPPLFTNYSNQIDNCNCDRFALLKQEASQAGYNPLDFTSMNLFLDANYRETLSLTLWTALQNCAGLYTDICGGSSAPSANSNGLAPSLPAPGCIVYAPLKLPEPVVIPPYLNCGYTKPCLGCTELTSLTAEFRLLYPVYAGVPYTGTNTTEAQIKENALWTRFLNFRTGFSLSAIEYLSAYARCGEFGNGGYIGNGYDCGAGTAVDNLLVNARLTPTSTVYIARQTIDFQNSFESNSNDEFTTSIEPGLGTCTNNTTGIAGDPVGGAGNYVLCSFDKPLDDISNLGPAPGPCEQVETQAAYTAQLLFNKRKEKIIADFEKAYTELCLGAKDMEQFSANYTPKEYHYTLYYYDQGGNLVKTLPPAAVKPNYNAAYLANVVAQRNAATDAATNNNELLATHYRYNTLKQVVAQKTPDAGVSRFWYDRLGRLVVSQNAKQNTTPPVGGGGGGYYSYTVYDYLGRITEVGQQPQATAMTQTISQDETALESWLNNNTAGNKEQITLTVYDKVYTSVAVSGAGVTGLYQKNLRNRVSYSMFFDSETQKTLNTDGTIAGGNSATYYSYDVHGNVDELLQDYKNGIMASNGNRFKKLVYSYDLISGKVNDVAYQPGETNPDQFYHRYKYDAENRLTEVYTSKDKIYWEREANYDYYRHGPLARTVLGQNQVQGIDYAYTIQGWLKGVNSNQVGNGQLDMGQDGTTPPTGGAGGSSVARDAYGYSLNYFDGDYQQIQTGTPAFGAIPVTLPSSGTGNGLYNGNISSMLVNIPQLGAGIPNLYGYSYDQLNRIVAMDAFTITHGAGNTISASYTQNYKERVSYDPNGNIRSYLRNGFGATLSMDNLTYQYERNPAGQMLSNKLRYVQDEVPDANYTEDINSQTTLNQVQVLAENSPAVAGDNYQYDAIGNLIKDTKEGISNIEWTVYGKIKQITKTDGTVISYTYDAAGNRLSKRVAKAPSVKNTFYVRDAGSNVMAVYSTTDVTAPVPNNGQLFLDELHLYGSSRLGVNNVNLNMNTVPQAGGLITFARGNKFFELSNHLGNVLVTISDKKIPVAAASGGGIDYYTADVVTANDYYPFGMQMPGRSFSQANSGYRYGFNGQEKSTEVDPSGNSMTAEFWQYDARLGRRWNVDPIRKQFESPYATMANNPLLYIDPYGLDTVLYSRHNGAKFHALTKRGGDSRNIIYTVDETQKDYDPKNPWKTATVLLYDVGTDEDKKAGKETGITGNSFHEYHPLYSKRKEVTGKFATVYKSPVYEDDLNDMTAIFTRVIKRGEAHFAPTWTGPWKLWFKAQVTDDGDYDIKSLKRDNLDKIPSFAAIKIGEWTLSNGRLTRYDDYGNIAYGYWGRIYGFSTAILVKKASENQDTKNGKTTTGVGDEPRDKQMILMGVELYDLYYKK